MKKPFADHAVVITGASSGIGAELARQLAAQGAWLALGARRAHELDLVAQECIARGGRALVVPMDVTDAAQCAQLIARTREGYGKVDVLINNAGLRAHFAFGDARDLGVFDRVMRVSYLGSVNCTHAALPALRESRGRIVGMSSLAGKTGVPLRTAYAASKHAMHGFFDSLRIELDGTGVSVTLICPGFVGTGPGVYALGPDGAPLAAETLVRGDAMPVDECARRSIRAVWRRQRELVMTPYARLAALVRVVAPGVVDRAAARTMGGPGAD
jgi:short-subunit dehydrogenase